MTPIQKIIRFLDDDGWSELIDSRWTLECLNRIREHFAGDDISDKDIKDALSIVIYPEPDYNPDNNEYL